MLSCLRSWPSSKVKKLTIEKALVAIILFAILLASILAFVLIDIARTSKAYGAEIALPQIITRGTFKDESPSLNRFGAYSITYMQSRWQRMCKGAARYDAMREANDLNTSNPCQ